MKKWILFLCLVNFQLYSRKVVIKNKNFSMNFFKDKHWLNSWSWFKIVPLLEILKNNPQVSYTPVTDKIFFDYPEFSISPTFPHKGYFDELFMLHIPQGKVQGMCGHVFIDNKLSDEMARGDRFECLVEIPKIKKENIKKISGRVAVIAQHGAGNKWANYYHAMYEVLGRLALLEMTNIEYDWLYVPLDKKYVREALELWGIDFNKIIAAENEEFCIEADQLIVPSMVINTSCGHKHAGNFQHPITSFYIKEKLLKNALVKNIDTSKYSRRIFISRKDAYNSRRILNEDDIFALFEPKRFKRYELSKMSVAEQILLFYNADVVVSEQGSGLANILFCKENTNVIEIFQALIDNCFWWISHMCGLNYFPILTIDIDRDYYAHWRTQDMEYYFKNNILQINIPLDTIKKYISFLELNNEI